MAHIQVHSLCVYTACLTHTETSMLFGLRHLGFCLGQLCRLLPGRCAITAEAPEDALLGRLGHGLQAPVGQGVVGDVVLVVTEAQS